MIEPSTCYQTSVLMDVACEMGPAIPKAANIEHRMNARALQFGNV